MSCLSGFKLYSRWVPLLLVSGCIYSFELIKKKKAWPNLITLFRIRVDLF